MDNKEYFLNISPSILELLGPSLYTNIYYILAELIANAYDADAKNVYIIETPNEIIVEDDGKGMSYIKGDINRYLDVAKTSRKTEEESVTPLGRRKMGRKGVGKLAALSVSENVAIMTIVNNEKSGFILSRHVKEDRRLESISDENITFRKVNENGTSVVMYNPQYRLNAGVDSIKRNILKLFPLVNSDFVIHIIKDGKETKISEVDREILKDLCAVISLGDNFAYMSKNFKTEYVEDIDRLRDQRSSKRIKISLLNNKGEEKEYEMIINGWIGAYKSTRNRKVEVTDFPDNFVSIYANKKLGEFNILPIVGKNHLNEVFVVGQLYIDLFELTELPDMALSNRQGYKSDDIRYQEMIKYVREDLLPSILKMREVFVDIKKKNKKEKELEKQRDDEKKLTKAVEEFKLKTSNTVADRLEREMSNTKIDSSVIRRIVSQEINANSFDIGLKSKLDSVKKKILISQTLKDKDLADIVYQMLLHNGVPEEDILYTNCDNEKSRIPEVAEGKSGIYDYLRDFFVNSYSTQKIYVLFVTSNNTKASWGALTEVGAAWITQINHKIFNISGFRPEHPLDDESEWHTTERDPDGTLHMTELSCDKFALKIETVCRYLGYQVKDREENKRYLKTLIRVV